MATATKRAALYVRVSTSDRGQSVENQLAPLQEAAGRLGWSIVAIFRDEGISGTKEAGKGARRAGRVSPTRNGGVLRNPPNGSSLAAEEPAYDKIASACGCRRAGDRTD